MTETSTVQLLYNYCTTTVQLLYNYCTTTVQLLYNYCTTTVQLLYNYCTTIVQLLYNYCTTTVQLLYAKLPSGKREAGGQWNGTKTNCRPTRISILHVTSGEHLSELLLLSSISDAMYFQYNALGFKQYVKCQKTEHQINKFEPELRCKW